MSQPPSERFSSMDVLPLLVPLLASQVSLIKRLRTAGLEIALMEEEWWWYLPRFGVQSSQGFNTFGDAVYDGLRCHFRLTDLQSKKRPPQRKK